MERFPLLQKMLLEYYERILLGMSSITLSGYNYHFHYQSPTKIHLKIYCHMDHDMCPSVKFLKL